MSKTIPLSSLAATLRRAGVAGVDAVVDAIGVDLVGSVSLSYQEVAAIAAKVRSRHAAHAPPSSTTDARAASLKLARAAEEHVRRTGSSPCKAHERLLVAGSASR